MLIGFTGKKQSGKDTAAKRLTDKGWERIAFADPMRWCLEALNPIVEWGMVFGAKEHEDPHYQYKYTELIDASGYDKAKETCPEFRRLIQVFGTEVGRDILGKYLGNPWLQIAQQRIFEADEINGKDIVITDVRFDDEAEMIRNMGGVVIRVERDVTYEKDDHVSEAGVSPHLIDAILLNNDSIAHLHQAVDRIVETSRKESEMENVVKEGDEGFVPDLDLKAMNFASLDVEDGHIADLVTTLYEDFVTAKADGKFDYQEIYGLFGILVEIGKHAIDVFENPGDHINAIVADLEKLFDLYVKPLDIPGLPNFIEGWVDNQLRANIRPVVELLLDKKEG